jgi:hypothetical protein
MSRADLSTLREEAITVEVMPRITSSRAAVAWKVRGKVQAPFTVTPQAIAYVGANRLVRGAHLQITRLTVTPSIALDTIAAECDPRLGTTVVTEAAGGKAPFFVEFLPNPALPLGSFSGVLRLQGTLENGDKLPVIPLTIGGSVVTNVRSVPERICFAAVRLGEPVEWQIRLESSTGRAFRISGMDVHDGEVIVSKSQDEYDGRHSAMVRVVPTVKGNRSLRWCVHVSFEDGGAEQVPIDLSYYGR